MTKKIIILLLMAVCTNIVYATDFVTSKRNSQSDIELTGTSDTITYDPLDWKGVRMAVENLRHDLKAVTGSQNVFLVRMDDIKVDFSVPLGKSTEIFGIFENRVFILPVLRDLNIKNSAGYSKFAAIFRAAPCFLV